MTTRTGTPGTRRRLAELTGLPDGPRRDRYSSLSVLEGRGALLSPWLATVMCGSETVHLSWGLTRWHALGRAARWARDRSDTVTVTRRAQLAE